MIRFSLILVECNNMRDEEMIKFKTGESRNQAVLFPSRIEDYLPVGHLAKPR